SKRSRTPAPAVGRNFYSDTREVLGRIKIRSTWMEESPCRRSISRVDLHPPLARSAGGFDRAFQRSDDRARRRIHVVRGRPENAEFHFARLAGKRHGTQPRHIAAAQH